jgi:hypothetical protein
MLVRRWSTAKASAKWVKDVLILYSPQNRKQPVNHGPHLRVLPVLAELLDKLADGACVKPDFVVVAKIDNDCDLVAVNANIDV